MPTTSLHETRGSVVVKEPRCKPEGLGFEIRWGESFSIYLLFHDALGPGVYLASNRHEYQKPKNNDSEE
jgi:hypothetical protein